jgi:hypothetical protein
VDHLEFQTASPRQFECAAVENEVAQDH